MMKKSTSSFQSFALAFAALAGCLAVAALTAVVPTSGVAADAGPGGTEWVKNVPVFGLTLTFS